MAVDERSRVGNPKVDGLATRLGCRVARPMARGGPMSPLSHDPERAAAQLEILRRNRRAYAAPERGNTRALKHGAYSVVAIGPLAAVWEQRFAEHLVDAAGDEWQQYIATISRIWARLEVVGNAINLRVEDAGRPAVMELIRLEQSLRAEAVEALERLKLAPLKAGDDALLDYIAELGRRLEAIQNRQAAPPETVVDADVEEEPDAASE